MRYIIKAKDIERHAIVTRLIRAGYTLGIINRDISEVIYKTVVMYRDETISVYTDSKEFFAMADENDSPTLTARNIKELIPDG